MKNTYKLLIAYDGTHYSGWQVQSNGTSIQELIEKALSTALRAPTPIQGSGRTDAGVHAYGQTAHFTHEHPLDLYKLQGSLNGLLPHDIRICSIEEAPADFHARYSATGKIYHYYLHLDPILDPFFKQYRYHVPHRVDLSLLEKAAAQCVGTHDFTSFSHEAHSGSAAKNPVRTIHRLQIVPIPKGIRLEFEGDGFLYKMVRNLVGTLLDISYGKIPLKSLPEIFAAKDRRKAGRTAPPHGLFLIKVNYPNSTLESDSKCTAFSLAHSET
ncbi:MAG: tRNA pseudouridine(38-40) synthase TruA [Parachlamydiales bacterium]